MNRWRRVCSVIIGSIMLLILCSCSGAHSDSSEAVGVVGSWSASWTYNGNNIEAILVFDDDGTFEKNVYVNGDYSSSSSDSGTYDVEDDEVECVSNRYGGTYTYGMTSSGGLTNGGHTYTRQ